jgi:hypothetical protein
MISKLRRFRGSTIPAAWRYSPRSAAPHPKEKRPPLALMRGDFFLRATHSSIRKSGNANSGLMHCSKQRFYSITSSAMESSDGGTDRPSARAVCRLRTNSSLVDCTTGRRSRARAAKAASISPIVVAFRISIFNPSAGAASCTSRNVDSVFEALAGLTSTAIRTACSFGRERNRRDAGRHLRRNGSKRAHKSPACL